MKAIGMRWLFVLIFLGPSAAAAEPDPRAEMAMALEAQADVAPSPPRFPERASLDVKPPIGPEDVGKREAVRAAVRAAIKAAIANVAHGAKGALPPPGQAARDNAASDHGNGPPPDHGQKKPH